MKSAVVISAGFAETGNQGRVLQDEITGIARKGGLRFVGPNCVGLYSATSGLNFSVSSVPVRGSIGFISQSGTLGRVFAQIASKESSMTIKKLSWPVWIVNMMNSRRP